MKKIILAILISSLFIFGCGQKETPIDAQFTTDDSAQEAVEEAAMEIAEESYSMEICNYLLPQELEDELGTNFKEGAFGTLDSGCTINFVSEDGKSNLALTIQDLGSKAESTLENECEEVEGYVTADIGTSIGNKSCERTMDFGKTQKDLFFTTDGNLVQIGTNLDISFNKLTSLGELVKGRI